MIEINRRKLLFGIGATLVAAPAIVRVTSLMAIKPIEEAWYWIKSDGFAWIDADVDLQVSEDPRVQEIMTEMLRHHTDKLADLVTRNNRLLERLKHG